MPLDSVAWEGRIRWEVIIRGGEIDLVGGDLTAF